MSMFEYFLAHNRYMNLVGIVLVLLIAWLFSHKRKAIDFRLIFIALGLQILIAFAVLRTSIGHWLVQKVANGVLALYQFADAGSSFLFGSLVDASQPWGAIFAFKVLPVIIFFSAVTALLFHFCVIQFFVGLINKVLQPLLRTSGAETLCAIANSFLGQTEAPLLIRNYLKNITRSEMMTVMVCGMATISGAVLVAYAAMGVPVIHLLAASVMGIPAGLLMAKILYPETETSKTNRGTSNDCEVTSHNLFDAIAAGTSDGLQIALAVGAMLIVFVALFALLNVLVLNSCLGINSLFLWSGFAWQMPVVDLYDILGYLFAPFAYLLGFSGQEALAAGQLLGTKLSINEFVAYGNMVTMGLSERTIAILTYALCGFANFSSIGIQVGGIGALVPEKRRWLTEFGLYAVLGGTLANLLSAMIVGLLL